MRYLKMFGIVLVVMFFLYDVNPIYADDIFEGKDEYDEGNGRQQHEEGRYEDLGELIGWCTFIGIGAAGMIFPIRTFLKSVTRTFPQSKGLYLSVAKLIGRYHILFGTMALLLGIGHGLIMYFNEGELENEGIMGLIVIILLLITAIIGTNLFNNRKNRSLRTIHMTIAAISVITGGIHIFIS
ncbi:hypothetical protein [Lysinibacillus sp. FSL K6-4013]|uniref:hypothetical protein n=1 Tax=Lysinibacillus sp. FSL K6-4013 TaxID=2921504 RepID=UPI00315A91D0